MIDKYYYLFCFILLIISCETRKVNSKMDIEKESFYDAKCFWNGATDSIFAKFDQELSINLPIENLNNIRNDVVKQFGDITDIKIVSIDEKDGLYASTIESTLNKNTLYLRIVYNSNLKIVGFFLHPKY